MGAARFANSKHQNKHSADGQITYWSRRIMPCPKDAIGNAIRKCPFLHQVSADQGEQYARQIATRPAVTAVSAGPRPVFEEKACDFEATLKLFHGAAGVVPLKKVVASTADSDKATHLTQTSLDAPYCAQSSTATQQRSSLSGAPFASMSMAGAFNFLVSIRGLVTVNLKQYIEIFADCLQQTCPALTFILLCSLDHRT